MVVIGSGLDRGIENAPEEVAKFSRRVLCNEVNFLNGVWTRRERYFVVVVLIVVEPVENVVAGLFAVPVYIWAADLQRVLSRSKRSRLGADDARSPQSEFAVVSGDARDTLGHSVIGMPGQVSRFCL